MGSKWIDKFSVFSTDKSRTYTVSRTDDNVWGCNCPAWRYQRARLPNGECKHIGQLKRSMQAASMSANTASYAPLPLERTPSTPYAGYVRARREIILDD